LIEYFTKAVDLNNDYEKAKSWKEKVEKEMNSTVFSNNMGGESNQK